MCIRHSEATALVTCGSTRHRFFVLLLNRFSEPEKLSRSAEKPINPRGNAINRTAAAQTDQSVVRFTCFSCRGNTAGGALFTLLNVHDHSGSPRSRRRGAAWAGRPGADRHDPGKRPMGGLPGGSFAGSGHALVRGAGAVGGRSGHPATDEPAVRHAGGHGRGREEHGQGRARAGRSAGSANSPPWLHCYRARSRTGPVPFPVRALSKRPLKPSF